MSTYPALTIRQPWATALVHPDLPKTIETRSRRLPAKYLGRDVAIISGSWTASEAFGIDGWSYCWPMDPIQSANGTDEPELYPGQIEGITITIGGPDSIELPLGCIVGMVRFVECLPIVDPDGGWGWDDEEATQIYVHGGVLTAMGPGFEHDHYAPNLPWGDYTPGRWAWVTDPAHSRLLADPIPARGALSWQTVEVAA